MNRRLALHWQIIIGILCGVLLGILLIQISWGKDFAIDWIKPFGTIFINLLKLIAIPLIVVSLIKGISDLKDITQLSKMGLRTFGLYIFTTIVAVTIGLLVVNMINPGKFISQKTRLEMVESFGTKANEAQSAAQIAKEKGPLQALIDVVPENIISSAGSNGNMLQVIFFSIIFGIALILIDKEKAKPVKDFFDGANEVVLKIVDIVMLAAPFGVFALICALIVESPSLEIFTALGAYSLTVLLGLACLLVVVYPLLLKFWGRINPLLFYKKLAPAQLIAFSTSSSAATLPVTMERVEEHIGVHKEVSSFVLPIGATINMDGTCLYQGVAAVFIAQVFGYDLSMMDQLSIVLTATLASIGAAAVPGAGILMLVIVLEAVGIHPAGIALIFAVDRILDMCRTVVNISGDAMVAIIINRSVGHTLQPKLTDSES